MPSAVRPTTRRAESVPELRHLVRDNRFTSPGRRRRALCDLLDAGRGHAFTRCCSVSAESFGREATRPAASEQGRDGARTHRPEPWHVNTIGSGHPWTEPIPTRLVANPPKAVSAVAWEGGHIEWST